MSKQDEKQRFISILSMKKRCLSTYKYCITNPFYLNANIFCGFLRKREPLKISDEFYLIVIILE